MNDLFIGGGGFTGVMFIGILEYLHEKKLLDIKNFYGTSIGSLIGILYISGIKPKDMIKKMIGINFSQVFNYNISNIINYHILEENCMDNFLNVSLDTLDKDITIKEFSEKFNVNINIYVTKLNTGEHINFNTIEYPDIKIKDAVKASMSIPFLFKPVIINEEEYVDGCCKNIYGSPKEDIVINGYSIISTAGENPTFVYKVIKSIFNTKKPNCKSIIECILDKNSASRYSSFNKIEEYEILELYKKGLYLAKEYFN
jgi:NTE family protein